MPDFVADDSIDVTEEESGERLDKFLSHNLEQSRSISKAMIVGDHVRVNGTVQKPAYRLSTGDEVAWKAMTISRRIAVPVNLPLDIVYEDPEVLVVNKPSGMVTHPAPGHHRDTLANALVYHIEHLSGVNGKERPGIVHRLDKDTSGLLMVAKTDDAHRHLSEELKARKTKRHYTALVEGVIMNQSGTIDAPIGRDVNNRLKMAVTDCGKASVTHFEVLERFTGHTLITCRLETGRTHQIRVHLQYIGHPILNDTTYGHAIKNDAFGQYLHARTLAFTHPVTHELLHFDSPLPDEFTRKIDDLKRQPQ
jgi:23S rRNA pseudouridine1911/1915/1917 synthase